MIGNKEKIFQHSYDLGIRKHKGKRETEENMEGSGEGKEWWGLGLKGRSEISRERQKQLGFTCHWARG